MKISVIIPVYNTEKFISRALDSILSQYYKDFEIICVDDGSTDNSSKIIKEKAKNNSSIKYYYQKNQGPGVARKNGFNKASGELIYFLDSDDYLINNLAFSKIIEIYNNYNPDVLFFNMKILKTNSEYIIKPFDTKKSNIGFNKISTISNLHINANLYSKIMKKRLLTESMFIESNTFEDFYTSYLYLDKCENYYYLDEVLYCCYHCDDNNNHLTTVDNFEKREKRINIVILTNSKIKNEIIKTCLADYCSRIIVAIIGFKCKYFFNIKKQKEIFKLKTQIKEIVNIVLDSKYKFYPKGKCKILKKTLFNIFLIMNR